MWLNILHSFPRSIVIDRDPIFCGQFWKELFKARSETQILLGTLPIDRWSNRSFKWVLGRLFEVYDGTDLRIGWSGFPWLNFGTILLAILLSRRLLIRLGLSFDLPYLAGDSSNTIVDNSKLTRETVLQLIKHNLQTVQNKMVQMADRRRIDREFNIGDWVYLKI